MQKTTLNSIENFCIANANGIANAQCEQALRTDIDNELFLNINKRSVFVSLLAAVLLQYSLIRSLKKKAIQTIPKIGTDFSGLLIRQKPFEL